MAEQSNKVFVRRGLSYEDLPALTEAVEAIFAQSPAAQRLGRESRVLLKPNLLAKHPPEHAVTTHPAVVEAVATVLRRREVGRIILADSCGGLYTEGGMRSIYRASGLAEICERMGVELWDKTTSAPRACDGALVHEFNLITPVQECDFIIDLPKFKTHVMTGMTAAVKNLFGCIPGLQKAEMHMRFPDRERFGQMLCDLAGAVAPDLVILDAIVGMEGDGPAGGHPRALGMLLGGSDPWRVDLTVARMMGLAPKRVPYLAAGIRTGVCPGQFSPDFLAPGADPADPIPDWQLPASFSSLTFSDHYPVGLRWAGPLVTRLAAPHPVIRRADCIGCGRCAEICPGHTIRIKDGKARIDPSGCIRCFCCHEMCPAKAIRVRRIPLFRL